MVIGNSSREMVVFRDRETLVDGRERTLEKVEALQLGFALSVSAVVTLHSQRLKMSVGEHLTRHGLLRHGSSRRIASN